jgi:cytochrome c oxidase subunit 2
VPAFRWKIDAVPGINTHYRVTPTRLGNYAIVCAELCGLGHATMRQTAHVLSDQNFQSWLKKQQSGGGAAAGGGGGGGGGGAAPNAKAIFTSAGCSACHTLAAAGSTGQTGPNLDQGLKGKDEAFIKQSIVDPNAVVTKGFSPGIMPQNYKDQLQPAEIDALVKYLKESTG